MNALTRLVMTLTAMVLLGQPIEAQSQRPLMYATRQCNEYAIELHLDPRRFQDFVGPGLPLALVEGKARVVIVVHDCSQLWIDGQDLGPAQEVRFWVAIRGFDDVRPVVGAEQTPPTRTWFTLFEGSSNIRLTWSPPPEGASPIIRYLVYRSLTSSDPVLLNSTLTTEYVDGNVTSGQTYHYWIAAENSQGQGPLSATLTGSVRAQGNGIGLEIVALVLIIAAIIGLRLLLYGRRRK